MEPIKTSRKARKLYRAHVKANTNKWGSFRAFVRDGYRVGFIAYRGVPHVSHNPFQVF